LGGFILQQGGALAVELDRERVSALEQHVQEYPILTESRRDMERVSEDRDLVRITNFYVAAVVSHIMCRKISSL
jgi:hypothetical protein